MGNIYLFEYPITVVWDLMRPQCGSKFLEWQSHPSGYSGWDAIYKDSLERRVDQIRGAVAHYEMQYPFVIAESNKNKAITSTFLGPDIPHMFPKQKTYAVTLSGQLAEQMTRDFWDSPYIVIKTPRDSGGQGVYFANHQDITSYSDEEPNALSAIFGSRTINGKRFPFSLRGHVVAQEGLKPMPLPISFRKGGISRTHFVLPTIRMVATIEPLKNRELRWHFHGAYYKLPDKSFASEESAMNADIHAKDSTAILSRVYDGHGSRAIPDAVFHEICEEIEAGLTPLFQKIRDVTPEDFALRALRSDNPGDHVSAVEFLMCYSRKRGADLSKLKPETREALVKAVEANPLLFAHIQYNDEEWSETFSYPQRTGLLKEANISNPLYGSLFGGLYR